MPDSSQPRVFILTYALAGFGHLRVTDALQHGLEKGTPSYLFASNDPSLTAIHNTMSIHPAIRAVMEWVQWNPVAEDLFVKLYRRFLVHHSLRIYQEFLDFLEINHIQEKHLVVVATHFGLAHQLMAVKKRMKKDGRDMTLIVQVTDDSPQHIWYVPGADLTFVPSLQTKMLLDDYGRENHLRHTEIVISPYPISPKLAEHLPQKEYLERIDQNTPDSEKRINICIPISGAAVGLSYYSSLIASLHAISSRFFFHIVAKDTMYVRLFLKQMAKHPYVKLHVSRTDKEVVDRYERVYEDYVFAFEIAKPSEQAFKVLADPKRVGGVTMLFCHPIGRQEYDNVDYMIRHNRMPTTKEQHLFWEYGREKTSTIDIKSIISDVHSWRGIMLPDNAHEAAQLVSKLLKQNVFLSLVQNYVEKEVHSDEMGSNGVEQFWKKVRMYLDGQLPQQ